MIDEHNDNKDNNSKEILQGDFITPMINKQLLPDRIKVSNPK
jgi:hypothetical protein